MARPRKQIDAEQVRKLAQIGCSGEEIAAVVGCERTTIYRRYADAIKEGHEHMRASLRRQQFALAMDKNPTMLIWLGKQYLGQKDKNELSSDKEAPLNIKVEFVKPNE